MIVKRRSLNSLFDSLIDDMFYMDDTRNSYLPLSLFSKESNASSSVDYDVIDYNDSVVLEVPLLGIDKKDVVIDIDDGKLFINANRKLDTDLKYLVRGTRFGELSLTYKIPNNTDTNNIDASMRNGMLIVTIPKHKKDKIKSIKIN